MIFQTLKERLQQSTADNTLLYITDIQNYKYEDTLSKLRKMLKTTAFAKQMRNNTDKT